MTQPTYEAPTDGRTDWIKPTLEKLPLDSALTGNAANGPSTDAMQTYPS